jgi:hypothetical protein
MKGGSVSASGNAGEEVLNFFKQPWVIAAALAAFSLILIYVYVQSKNPSFLTGSSDVAVPQDDCTTCTQAVLPTTALPLATLSAGSSSVKRALLIGCNYNYPGSACIPNDCTLRGCIQDVRNISSILQTRLGFQAANIDILVDDGSTAFPSKQTIVEHLTQLVESTGTGDSCFVWYSGHGAQVYNPSSEGNYDECWCPPDTIQSGEYLTDDELSLIVRRAPANSRIFVGSDSCHSGTVFDLQYIAQEADAQGANRSMNRIRGRIPLPKTVFDSPFKSNLHPGRTIQREEHTIFTGRGLPLVVISDSKYSETSATIVALSGSQDYDTSADAFEGGQYQGAMSWAFGTCLSSSITLADLLKNMRVMLKNNGYSQIPQIQMGNLMNPNLVTFGSLF